MFESLKHSIEDVDHWSHKDEVNQFDCETVVSFKRRVGSFNYLNELILWSTNVLDKMLLEEVLTGRRRDDENSIKYKGAVGAENAILDAHILFP